MSLKMKEWIKFWRESMYVVPLTTNYGELLDWQARIQSTQKHIFEEDVHNDI